MDHLLLKRLAHEVQPEDPETREAWKLVQIGLSNGLFSERELRVALDALKENIAKSFNEMDFDPTVSGDRICVSLLNERKTCLKPSFIAHLEEFLSVYDQRQTDSSPRVTDDQPV